MKVCAPFGQELVPTQDSPSRETTGLYNFARAGVARAHVMAFPLRSHTNLLCAVAHTVIVSTAPDEFAIEAVVNLNQRRGGGFPREWYDNLLSHWGLNERQLPMLTFGPGMKGPAPRTLSARTVVYRARARIGSGTCWRAAMCPRASTATGFIATGGAWRWHLRSGGPLSETWNCLALRAGEVPRSSHRVTGLPTQKAPTALKTACQYGAERAAGAGATRRKPRWTAKCRFYKR
eukprot:2996389-Prymnesium_polylepis.2